MKNRVDPNRIVCTIEENFKDGYCLVVSQKSGKILAAYIDKHSRYKGVES